MSLLREIQEATTNPDFKISDILRKCKILAARLDHKAFKDWVDQELKGYQSIDNCPEYRVFRNVESVGDFIGLFGSRIKNGPIPSLCLPEDFRENLTTLCFLQSISNIESLIDNASSTILRLPWSANLIMLIQPEVYENMVCVTAWRMVGVNAVVGIIDTIKTRILEFVLEIERIAPNAGEVKLGQNAVPEKVVNQIFNECILQVNNEFQLNHNSKNITSLKGVTVSDNYSTNIQAGRDASGIIGGSDINGVVAGGNINGNLTNTFTQHTNSDINEIIKLTELLHQQLKSLPSDNQDVAVDSLETLKSEIITPTKPGKLKSALFALWSIGKDVATFANAVSAIAERLGINLIG
jgi:hypothetical protein